MGDVQEVWERFKAISEFVGPVAARTSRRWGGAIALVVSAGLLTLTFFLGQGDGHRAKQNANSAVQTSSLPFDTPSPSPESYNSTGAIVPNSTQAVSSATVQVTSTATPIVMAPPPSAIFITANQTIESSALKVRIRMHTMPITCAWFVIEIERWHPPRNFRDYQKPLRICPDDPGEFDRIIIVGTDDSRECGKVYEVRLIEIPDRVYLDWRSRYIDNGEPIEAQPEPEASRVVTHSGLTLTVGGRRCEVPPVQSTPTVPRRMVK